MVASIQELKQGCIRVLNDYLDFLGSDPHSEAYLAMDEANHHYLLIEVGWQSSQRIYGTLIHLDVIEQKIWIQQDGTEAGVATELVELGIPKDQIVLAFKSPERRQITEFAVS